MKSRSLLGLGTLGTLCLAAPAYAGVSPVANVAVTLNVVNSCNLTGASGTLDFGTQNAGTTAANIDAASTGLVLTCTGDSPTATMNVNGGSNLTAVTQRRLKLGAAATFVPYDLYVNAGRTTKLDPGVNTAIPGGILASSPTVTIYGRIPSGTALVNGNGTNFTDTVSLTITF